VAIPGSDHEKGRLEVEKRVCVLDMGYDSYQIEEEALAPLGYRLDLFEGGKLDFASKLAFARGAEGVFVRWSEFDSYAFDQLPGLRCLVRCGIGYDNVDLHAASAHGVKVCNVQGYANHSVSDHALALILSSVRGLPEGMRRLRPGYNHPSSLHTPELHTLTLGIIGLGRIGGTLCQKALPLFKRVLAYDPYIPSERFTSLGAASVSMKDLLAQSDVISLHCNLTDETRHMINKEALAFMGPHTILINTARGPVVDEDALTEALFSGKIHAAAMDVFADEPPLSNRDDLLSHPRFIATGHYAWYSNQASRQLQYRATLNMVAMLRGDTPEDCLNRAELGLQ